MKILHRARGTSSGGWTSLPIGGHDYLLPQTATQFSSFELIVGIDLSIRSAQTLLDANHQYLGDIHPGQCLVLHRGRRTRVRMTWVNGFTSLSGMSSSRSSMGGPANSSPLH